MTTPGYHPGYPQTQVNSSSAGSAKGARVELRIPASAMHIPTVRTVAADLAGRQDFDLDGIHDFRMAVDEACAQLVGLAAPGATLGCVFFVSHTQIEVTASVQATRAATLATNTFGWQVLSTLTDLVEPIPNHPDGNPPEVGIRLRVNRDRNVGA